MPVLRMAEKLLEAMVALLLFALVAMVFTNVMLRFFMNSGIVVTEEVSRIVLSILILSGAVLALIQQRHIAMTLVVDRLPETAKKVVVAVTGAVMLYGNWLLAKGAWMQATLNFSSSYPISGLPMATIYVAATLAGAALALVVAARMVLILAGRMPADRFFQAASADIAE
ncbi:MAG: TRAP transporter small permease [Rhodobacteraceae bacterium]|jgi:TRAP-type C4-dicarboxylate transport system permease small subunit|uniref:TRAP transporter small permease protein n=1 Tax=Salipiger profundus TaxID=1229727 RepID=A0A1U7D7S9_9RHOB|nr:MULTISPECIES: TRAP transporter small permease [Salipiger]APX24126.1 TRAP-type C4-dicarboxylate transport system, small permease component [Salipiger profundus]MAB06914.1 TRAP transporter small permease [Paracoccaceae bacterium]GFZ94782.1 putative TRAP transporter small permease protein [Salipiger profundus]SFB90339.1 TRAP-type C4-dicarboxylate transport system, small permease component [Salipiger profundus]